jgi:hypothetical protein
MWTAYSDENLELLRVDGPDIKFKRSQLTGHIVGMGKSIIPTNVPDGRFHGRKHERTPRLRREDIKIDFLLLLDIRWRRLAGGRDIWKRIVEVGRERCWP